MEKIIAGNWKMHMGREEARTFLHELGKSSFTSLVIFPQAPLLSFFQTTWKSMGGGHGLCWGPQHLHWEEKGAFTGEVSPALAKEFGSSFSLAGHSERRQFFGETNTSAAQRALAALRWGMRPIFCVGEGESERDAGQTFSVLAEQCGELFRLSPEFPEGIIFAYEPVWAIGTGRTASASQAQEVHGFLRKQLEKHWSAAAALATPLLYGGSVKPQNAAELMAEKDVDGVLVGGASLDPSSFLAIAAARKG